MGSALFRTKLTLNEKKLEWEQLQHSPPRNKIARLAARSGGGASQPSGRAGSALTAGARGAHQSDQGCHEHRVVLGRAPGCLCTMTTERPPRQPQRTNTPRVQSVLTVKTCFTSSPSSLADCPDVHLGCHPPTTPFLCAPGIWSPRVSFLELKASSDALQTCSDSCPCV